MPGFTEEMQEAMLASLRAKSAADLARMLRGAAASDLPDPAQLRGLEIPALVIATRGDPGHPLSTAEKLVELLPNAELRVLDSLPSSARSATSSRGSSTAPGARFERARADEIDVYSPDRFAARRALRRLRAAAPRAAGALAADTGRWRLLGAHEARRRGRGLARPGALLLGARASW